MILNLLLQDPVEVSGMSAIFLHYGDITKMDEVSDPTPLIMLGDNTLLYKITVQTFCL